VISGMLVFPLIRGVVRHPVGAVAGKVAIITSAGKNIAITVRLADSS
jgi:hypothetical protein